jgi:type I restriction enzyme S subunit
VTIKTPIPLINEQQKIVNFLDYKTGQCDRFIGNRQKQIELLNEQKATIINKAVTKGINPNAKMKPSGIEWIGDIPEHWECMKIKRLSVVKRGASPRPIDDPKYFDENGEFAWVRIADVTASERYLENTTQRLSKLGSSLSVKMYPNDFFLSIAGSVGKPIITKIKCCIHDGFVWFPYLKINHEFLYYLFSTGLPYQGLGKFGTQLNLNTDTVGDIFLPIPTADEMTIIVSFIDNQTQKIDCLISKYQKQIELMQEYRTALISQAVTGKIDVREWKPQTK